MKLIREDGRVAGLYDICDWWIESYPDDVFIGLSGGVKEVCDVRLIMRKILLRRVTAVPSSSQDSKQEVNKK